MSDKPNPNRRIVVRARRNAVLSANPTEYECAWEPALACANVGDAFSIGGRYGYVEGKEFRCDILEDDGGDSLLVSTVVLSVLQNS